MKHLKIKTIFFVLLAVVLFSSCQHQHDFEPASCTNPEICRECGAIGREPYGHNWSELSCCEPQSCKECFETSDEILEHDWKEATYLEPKKCYECYTTEGDPLSAADLPMYTYIVWCSNSSLFEDEVVFYASVNGVEIECDYPGTLFQGGEKLTVTITEIGEKNSKLVRVFDIPKLNVGDNYALCGYLKEFTSYDDVDGDDYYIDIIRLK